MTGDPALRYEVHGTGRDLVLLHPVGLDASFMGPPLADASRGFRVVQIDLRGHGRSPSATPATTLSDYVADIARVIDAACKGPAIVLGLSFGGMLAQMLALTHPQKIAALVLCGCGSTFAAEVRPILRERGLAAERGGMACVVEATVERWFTAEVRSVKPPAQIIDTVRARLGRDDAAGWSAAWHAIATFDALPRLREIAVPALVVAGERDAATPVAAARTLADAIPGARLEMLAGAPHMMQLERPDQFNRVVAAFVERWRAPAA